MILCSYVRHTALVFLPCDSRDQPSSPYYRFLLCTIVDFTVPLMENACIEIIFFSSDM